MAIKWLNELIKLAEKNPIVILRFEESEWESLLDSRHSVNEFTIARPHALIDYVSVPNPCLIHSECDEDDRLFFGLISSRSPVTTLESRIKVKRGVQIEPGKISELLRLVSEKPHAMNLKNRLQYRASVIPLSPKLSSHLIEKLASIKSNHGALRIVAESLFVPKQFSDNSALQEDALHTALTAFGLTPDNQVLSLELVKGRETALARISITEDSVIEHDARSIPGYDLVQSDMTGRAVFENSEERLEVFTANRRDLEHCFGVDLIYLNASKQNIVMLQYKMLEPYRKIGKGTDWIFRPDSKLDDEIRRMNKYANSHPLKPHEYRLNPAVFYLKFVKRDGSIRNGGIITPLDHFEKLRNDPKCKGPRKGLRVSYKSLSGRYLRQSAFLDLLRSGYIGAHAETTKHLMVIINAVLKSNRAVVAALQKPRSGH